MKLIPKLPYSVFVLQTSKYMEMHETKESSKRKHSRSSQQLHEFQSVEYNKFDLRVLHPSERHQLEDRKRNISIPHAVAREQNGQKPEHHEHRVIRKGGPDIPLLLTMFVWFLMIYFGLKRFIKSNDQAVSGGYFPNSGGSTKAPLSLLD